MALPAWARLQEEYPCPLRRGAWYRVMNATSRDVVVEVHKKPVQLPRRVLQLVDQPPQVWTVVERAKAAPYAVCPSCRQRVPLEGRPTSMRCGKCNGMFSVAWAETGRPAIQVMPSSEERRPRLSMPTVPRKRGPDRRSGERREMIAPVNEDRRSGSERRQRSERRKGRPSRPKPD
jgi:hypothetical protein